MKELTPLQILGRNLRTARLSKNMTLQQVAIEAGSLTLGHISNIENGRKNLTFGALERICNALGVKIMDMLEGVDLS